MPSHQKVVVLDSEDTEWCMQKADVSHQLQGNLLIKSKNEFISSSAVLSKNIAHMIPLRLITGSDNTSGFYAPAKRNCPKKWLVIQRQESSPDWSVRLRSCKRFSCPELIPRTQVLLVKISTVRHPSDDDTLKHHLERTNNITYWLIHYDLSFSYIGHGWEFMNGKCPPVRHTQLPLPHQVTPRDCIDGSNNESSCSSLVTTTVTFLTQPI